MALTLFEDFGKAFIPDRFRPRIRGYLGKAGVHDIPYRRFGELFTLGIIITLALYILFAYPYIRGVTTEQSALGRAAVFFVYTFISFAITGIAISYLFMSLIYFWLDMRIYRRTTEMERVLVEFLQFVSENLKAGMSFDRALFFAIKPQFTVLAAEVRIAAKRAMTGEDVEEALSELAQKYDSNTMSRSLSLIVEGLRSGGGVAYVIDRVVENLRETKKLKEEMNATTLGYVIFISFVVMVIAPGLYALSKQLLIILSKFISQVATTLSQAQNFPLKLTSVAITPADFTTFSYMGLLVVSLFSAMIISIVQRGNVKGGIKYVPVFMLVSVGFFYLFSTLLAIASAAFFPGV